MIQEAYIAGSWRVNIDERTLPESKQVRNFLVCHYCGNILPIETFKEWIGACETGFLYCSTDCAEDDVKDNYDITVQG